jgi:hypothetical protein
MPSTVRHGVVLTRLKARIFDLIKRSDGINASDINEQIFHGRVQRETIKAHIWQINEALADTGVRIWCTDTQYQVVTRRNWSEAG